MRIPPNRLRRRDRRPQLALREQYGNVIEHAAPEKRAESGGSRVGGLFVAQRSQSDVPEFGTYETKKTA